MSTDWSDSLNPYTILQLENGPDSTKEEIRKAYKKMALLKHPDKNKNNPKAHEEFAELRKALDVLEDKDARAALDDLLRARAARDARLSQQDDRRKRMRQDLERREQQAFSEKSELEVAKARLMEELQRLRKKAVEQEKQRMAAAAQAWAAEKAAAAAAADPGQDPELQETLQRSLKVSWTAADGDYSEQQLREVFEKHGQVESVNKLGKKKKKQTASALVVMRSVAAAQSALNSVCGDIKNPLLVLPAKKASSAQEPPGPPSPSPWPTFNPAGSTFPSASFTSQDRPQRPLFPGGAPNQSNGTAAFAFKPSSMNSFASFEAAILAKCRKQGQQQKEAEAAQKMEAATTSKPAPNGVQREQTNDSESTERAMDGSAGTSAPQEGLQHIFQGQVQTGAESGGGGEAPGRTEV